MMDEKYLQSIPHIDEIAHRGVFSGVPEKITDTFQNRSREKNKLLPSLEDAIRATGLRDGMTISFHHHFRGGDHVVNKVVDTLARMGFKNLTLAASSLAAVHAPLVEHIKNGVITHIETSGLRGELAEQVSRGLMDCPVVFRSHGGRAAAIRSGELHIDVAFLGAPSCDPYGNANGYSREEGGTLACGSMGYARTDAKYADQVVILTNRLVQYPNAPWAIPEYDVDYIVVEEDIGDPKGIMSGATRYTKNPKELLIAQTAANVIDAAGYLYDGFSMQMGSGGASLATARFIRQMMLDKSIRCRFALGGITGQITAMHEEGLIDRVLDRGYLLCQLPLRRRGGPAGLCGAVRFGDRHGFQCERPDRVRRRHPRRHRRTPGHCRRRQPVGGGGPADQRTHPLRYRQGQHGGHPRRGGGCGGHRPGRGGESPAA